jgi:hypothetical protein
MAGRLCSSVAVEAVGYQSVEAHRTEYLFEVQNDDEKWTIHREATDFVELHSEIRGDAHGLVLPKACAGSGLLDWVVSEEQIMHSLEKYIDTLLEHHEASSQQALWEFLDLYGEEGQPPGSDITLPKQPELGLGLVLEEDKTSEYQVVVRRFTKLADGSVGAAESSGQIKPGDRIVAVEWSSTHQHSYDDVLDRVADAPNPVTVRFASDGQLAEHMANQQQKRQEEEELARELDAAAVSVANGQNGNSDTTGLTRLAATFSYEGGKLKVTLEQASAILNTQMLGVQDPYIVIKMVRTWRSKREPSKTNRGKEGNGAGRAHREEKVEDIVRESVQQTMPVVGGGSNPVFTVDHDYQLVFPFGDPVSGQPTRFMGRKCSCSMVFEIWNGSNSLLSLVHNLIGTASLTLPDASSEPHDLAALLQPSGHEYIIPVDTGGTLQLVLQVGLTTSTPTPTTSTGQQPNTAAAQVAAQYAAPGSSPTTANGAAAVGAGARSSPQARKDGGGQGRPSVATSRGLDNKLEQSMRRISDFASNTIVGLGSLLGGGGEEEDLVIFESGGLDYDSADETRKDEEVRKQIAKQGRISVSVSAASTASPSWAQSGELVVEVTRAQGLKDSQRPYVLCYLMPSKLSARSKPCEGGGKEPRWGLEHDFQLRFCLDAPDEDGHDSQGGQKQKKGETRNPTSLLLEVWNSNALLSDTMIGSVLVPLPITERALGERVSHPLNSGGFLEFKLLHHIS